MIVNDKTKNLETEGLGQQASFSIKASGFAFKALSESLYSDKPGSIVRELYSNAYDAHKLVGKENLPADIQLPTVFEPVFRIRDYGPGMTNEEMLTLYTTMFESTKRHTNDQIGGFGLGSKTPFAYTDQFTVECWQEGTKRTYLCFLSEDETPQLNLVASETSTEPSGLAVSFAVQPGDYGNFAEAVGKQLYYFEPRPNVSPAYSWEEAVVRLSGPNWKLIASRRVSTSYPGQVPKQATLVVGQVGYPIDTDVAELIAALSDAQLDLLKKAIVIWVPVGALDVTVSRESLSFTKRTIAALKVLLTEVLTSLAANLTTTLNSQPTRYAAFQESNQILRALGINNAYSSWPAPLTIALRSAVTYKREDLRELQVTLPPNTQCGIAYISSTGFNAKAYKFTTISTMPPPGPSPSSPNTALARSGLTRHESFITFSQYRSWTLNTRNLPVLIHADTSDWFARLKHHEAETAANMDQATLLVVQSDAATFQAIARGLGDPPTALASSFSEPPKAVVAKATHDLTSSLMTYLYGTWTPAELPVTPGYYVYTKDGTIYNGRPGKGGTALASQYATGVWLNRYIALGFISDRTEIVGVQVKGHAKITKAAGWTEFTGAMKEKLEQLLVTEQDDFLTYDYYINLTEDGKAWLTNAIKIGALANFPQLARLSSIQPNNVKRERYRYIKEACGNLNITLPIGTPKETIAKLKAEIATDYPKHAVLIENLTKLLSADSMQAYLLEQLVSSL